MAVVPTIPLLRELRDLPGSKFRGAISPNGRLLLFVHGFLGDATETWGDFVNLLGRSETKDFDAVFYYYHVTKSQVEILSQLLLDALSYILAGDLNKELLRQGILRSNAYTEVVICAHSLGAVLVRDALIRAIDLEKS